jgi:hypothetical protein
MSIFIDEDLFNRIVELANKRRDATPKHQTVCLNDEESVLKAFTLNTESLALKQAIEDLTPNQAAELAAIMYFGRDGGDFLYLREEQKERREVDVKTSLLEKMPLGEYLSEGLRKLQELTPHVATW